MALGGTGIGVTSEHPRETRSVVAERQHRKGPKGYKYAYRYRIFQRALWLDHWESVVNTRSQLVR